MTIDDLIRTKKVLVTCGTGGVGKTTLSAAIAVRAAQIGKKVAVITIDPAKRLATSLGIDGVGHAPHSLTHDLEFVAKKKKEPCTGQLFAIMPDTRHTFEAFVHRMAPSSHVAEKVFANPIFQIFAKEFAGTNEYMAMERLYSLTQNSDYDLVVLDTPPSRNALSFLEAPQLMNRFFDDRIIKWLVVPANQLLAAGMKKAFGLLERLTGSGFMGHLFDFAQALFEVRVNFQKNLSQVTDLLQSSSVGFLFVTSATPDTALEAAHFVESVKKHGFHYDGLLINRTLMGLGKDQAPSSFSEYSPGIELLDRLQAREERAIDQLSRSLPTRTDQIRYLLPELARDIHSLEDLFELATFLGNIR
jgi:anion-transporting  ArsA/GET3 family ATPase